MRRSRRHEFDAGLWPWPPLPDGSEIVGLEFDANGLVGYLTPPKPRGGRR